MASRGSGRPGASTATTAGAAMIRTVATAASSTTRRGRVAPTRSRTGSWTRASRRVSPALAAARRARAWLKAGTISSAMASSISSVEAISGTVQAMRKASLSCPAPKRCAMVWSRTSPNTAPAPVNPAVTAAALARNLPSGGLPPDAADSPAARSPPGVTESPTAARLPPRVTEGRPPRWEPARASGPTAGPPARPATRTLCRPDAPPGYPAAPNTGRSVPGSPPGSPRRRTPGPPGRAPRRLRCCRGPGCPGHGRGPPRPGAGGGPPRRGVRHGRAATPGDLPRAPAPPSAPGSAAARPGGSAAPREGSAHQAAKPMITPVSTVDGPPMSA